MIWSWRVSRSPNLGNYLIKIFFLPHQCLFYTLYMVVSSQIPLYSVTHLWNFDGSCTLLSQRRGLSPSLQGSAGNSASSLCPQGWLPPDQKPATLIVTVLCPQCLQCVCPHRGGWTCNGVYTASHWKRMCLHSIPLENTDFQELLFHKDVKPFSVLGL